MPGPAQPTEEATALAAAIAEVLRDGDRQVAVAESLTSGTVASHLGAAEGASAWFAGGVVAYASEVKFKVLDVDPGPVVSARCAEQMARGVAGLTAAHVGVSATGVGGPDPEEGKPAGTVFIAVSTRDGEEVAEHHFDGDPAEVVQAATVQALRMLLTTIRR
ncbi:CinA family protein [Kribbella sancticallisti]|uniref:CinA family protein n=1 Tax=Kribbella sancticallisti TaxID=460087 RepID=A0ABP4P2B0_9ACTN